MIKINHLQQLELTKMELTGLFGYPVEHSFSPPMQNAGFAALDLDYLYLPFAVQPDNLESAVAGIRGLELAGVNLTIPHKESVLAYLDRLAPAAELIGAVNTVVNQSGQLVGHNTDGQGFIRSLQEEIGFEVKGKKILIIGAGGAARAVAFQSGLEGGREIYIANRTPAKAEALATEIDSKLELEGVEGSGLERERLSSLIAEVDLLVDTTPVGMPPETDVAPVIDPQLLVSDLVVADLVYNPRETVLLKAAKEVGARPLSGLGMLLYQGVIAFELWTGESAPVAVMKEELVGQV